jgi:D-galactarolactone cycloisomerase
VRITAVELRRYAVPLDPPFVAAWDPVPRDRLEATLVFVHTDDGRVGVGSGDTMDGFERFEHLFVGRDPLELERHVRVLETIAFHAGRYWPLEAALWDLAGQAVERPVADLLGAGERRLPAYASTGELKPARERAESALRLRDEGFRALKLRMDGSRLAEGVASARAVREAVGETMEIMVDLNLAWRIPGDLRDPPPRRELERAARELAELRVLWLEEPLPTSDVVGHIELRDASGISLAGGEMARTVPELVALLDAGALDVFQPDAVLAVGTLNAAEFARRVHAAGRSFTPHTWTNGIGLLANVHLAAGVGVAPYLELPYDPPGWTPERRDWMLAEPVRLDGDGCVAVPDRPGLGVGLDEERLERHRVG